MYVTTLFMLSGFTSSSYPGAYAFAPLSFAIALGYERVYLRPLGNSARQAHHIPVPHCVCVSS